MGKFDTHGGYFAPKDYFRINEGGSHSENPNGGVQIGVDQNGVPNLLEEGEPVFKDFVFSDNIKANKSILKDMSIPEKYAGMLYSEIADKFIEEAEMRPMDPVSNNGLRAMLSRLADAQEEQKLRKEENDLKAELKKLSPEELAMLNSEIIQSQNSAPQETIQVQPQMQVPSEVASTEQTITPIMANGGNLFFGGSRMNRDQRMLDRVTDRIGQDFSDVSPLTGLPVEQPIQPVLSLNDGPLSFVPGIGDIATTVQAANDGDMLSIAALPISIAIDPKVGKAFKSVMKKTGSAASKLISNIPKKTASKAAMTAEEAYDAAYNRIPTGKKVINGAKTAAQIAFDPSFAIRKMNTQGKSGLSKFGTRLAQTAQSTAALGIDTRIVSPVIEGIKGTSYRQATDTDDLPVFEGYENGGKLGNMFYDGSPALGFKYLVTPDSKYLTDYGRLVHEAAAKKSVKKPTSKTTTTASTSATSVAPTVNKIAPIASISDIVKDYATKGRVAENNYDFQNELLQQELNRNQDAINMGLQQLNAEPSTSEVQESSYPTAMRYAGILNNLFATMNNMAQTPDKYQYTPVSVDMPTVDMPLQMQQYIPVDMSLPMNQIAAQSNATSRAIRNSGSGPATGALLLANGLNAGNALGNAALQGYLTNAQQRNATIAANNAAIAQRASMLQQAAERRAELQAQIDMQNRRNALQIQGLNNQSRQEKASAVGATLENLASGLAGIGTENFRLNTLKNLPYTMDDHGNLSYNSGARGGCLKKFGK